MQSVNVYAFVAPVVLSLILLEFIYCLVKQNGYYSFQDSLMGMGTMIIAQCVNVGVAALIFSSYGYIYRNFAFTHLAPSFLNLLLCFIGVDFLFYWFHRAGHRTNILWAAHSTHHSAEELNYAVALRTSFTQRAASFLFYWPLALAGFAPEIIIPVVAVNLVYQFVPHTRVVGRLPRFIDSWLNTPYHHQVHHAANPIYWDRNYGGTFIVWDKLFGTYRDQSEEPYYGITIHPKSWDPSTLNFHWFLILWNDMKSATHFSDKLKIWFMPPGWRPRNLEPFPKNSANAKMQIKFQTVALKGSKLYLILQMALSMGILLFAIRTGSPLSILEKFGVTLFLWIGITLWAAILESKSWAKWGEILRIICGAIFFGLMFKLHSFDFIWTVFTLFIAIASLAWVLLGMGECRARVR